MSQVRPRPVVRVIRACDNACVFCGQSGLAEDGAASIEVVSASLAALRAQGHTAVTFAGGEPLLHPALTDHVALARSLGFESVGVQTNARGLEARAHTLRERGLTDVHLSVHGATAELHEHHTGVSGSYEALRRGADAARAVGLAMVATTVLTRSNFRALDALP